MRAWLSALVAPANVLQVLLVVATCSGIVFQYRLFDLEKEYKEISVRPILVAQDVRFVPEFGMRNVGVGSAEIMAASYESDSFQRIETDVLKKIENNVESRIRDDLRAVALKDLSNFRAEGAPIPSNVDFITAGSFLPKDQTWYFAQFRMDELERVLNEKKKSAQFEDSRQSIQRKLSLNESAFRIEICYCSISRRECKTVAIGTRGQSRLNCARWEGSRI